MKPSVIEAIDLEVYDPETRRSVSRPVSFSLSLGDLCVITGPNGVGKSTLLHGMADFLSTSNPASRVKGIVRTRKEVLGDKSFKVRLHPQFSAPMFALPLSLGDVLDWYRSPEDSMPELIRDLDLLRPWDSASGGEKQRVLLAGIFSDGKGKHDKVPFEILLLDEPGNHLDSRNREELYSQTRQWLSENPNRCVVVVTHDPEVWSPSVLVKLEAAEK
ncbi:MAG: AAA family ATPase [Deltaproteobacteria bacterium]|nr:AAA family ATPase [Deltaproteobacteria bacterium]